MTERCHEGICFHEEGLLMEQKLRGFFVQLSAALQFF
jgi:hypothetical protein